VRPLRILKRPAVEAKAGLSKTHLYLQINEGSFPKPVRLGRKSVGWAEHEVDAWIEARIRERDGAR